MSAVKGSEFERAVCRELSLWWTAGERDDVFWRTSQSGGRATERAKRGKGTFGAYGDVAAVDPAGLPLLEVFTIELKRGDTYGSPWEWFDSDSPALPKPWSSALLQAVRSSRQAGSFTWLLAHRRDRRQMMVCVGGEVESSPLWHSFARSSRIAEIRHETGGDPASLIYFYLPWEEFRRRVNPAEVVDFAGLLSSRRCGERK